MADVAVTENQSQRFSPDDGTRSSDPAWSQYVTFTVDNRAYGIEVTKVREIKVWSEPTELPNAPHAMRGVLNLRGVIVPVYDLRARFGQGATQASGGHVVIIIAIADQTIGVLVDAVSDILTIEPNEVLPMPDIGGRGDQSFLAGLVSRDDRLVALLRLEALFDISELPAHSI